MRRLRGHPGGEYSAAGRPVAEGHVGDVCRRESRRRPVFLRRFLAPGEVIPGCSYRVARTVIQTDTPRVARGDGGAFGPAPHRGSRRAPGLASCSRCCPAPNCAWSVWCALLRLRRCAPRRGTGCGSRRARPHGRLVERGASVLGQNMMYLFCTCYYPPKNVLTLPR
jgi:hypothetical protein